MKLNMFAKSVKKSDGGSFTRYLGRITDKAGKEYPVTIKFKGCEPPQPKACPMVAEVPKAKAQLSHKTERNAVTGEEIIYYTLWVEEWARVGDFVDNSLENFED